MPLIFSKFSPFLTGVCSLTLAWLGTPMPVSWAAESVTAPAAAAVEAPLVVGYFPNWSTSPTPEQVRYDRYTHIVHAFASVNAEGKLQGGGNLPSLVLTKGGRAAGTAVLLGLGGGSNGANFARMVRSETLRTAFISDVVTMVKDYGYSGADLDWEYPEKGDEDALVSLVTELSVALRQAVPGALLTLAAPRGNYYGQWFDVPRLRTHLDWIHVMTYDQHGPWSHAGHNAALNSPPHNGKDESYYSYEFPMNYWLQRGFQKKQILMGMACYGRGYVARQWGEKPSTPSQYASIAFKDIGKLMQQGWTRQFDALAASPWLKNGEETQLLSYDDEQSIGIKASWTRNSGARGYFFWNINQDYVGGDNVLAAAARSGWDRPYTTPAP